MKITEKKEIIVYREETEEAEGTFYGNIDIETNSDIEYKKALDALLNLDRVCHCNIKENAELICKIMDYDVENKAFPLELVLEANDGNWYLYEEPDKNE